MIDLKNESTYRPIHNDGYNWSNRLTIYSNGDIWIQEFHRSNQYPMKWKEFNLEARSINLPDSISLDDVYQIADKVLPLIDAKDWDYAKVCADLEAFNQDIYEIVEGYVADDEEEIPF